ncbi:NDP-sugar synthase [Streptomyces sp. NPDC056161]|uniref:nucleotidyltransferase family protein n=1 Tax=Streptomyces sp. NPDC056161 TaxID=3345732 RepID=UPI0035DE2FD9
MRQVVVLCGGYGRRMGEITGGRQKCLVTVAGRPFLWHVLDAAAVEPTIDEIVLLAAHEAARVEEFAEHWHRANGQVSRVRVVAEQVAAGPVAALRAAADSLAPQFLLLLGDVLPPPGEDLRDRLSATAHETGADAVMLTAPVSAGYDPGNVLAEGARVTRYGAAATGELIDRGVRWMRADVVTDVAGDDDARFFGTLARQGRLAHHRVDDKIVEVGTPQRWSIADALLSDRGGPASGDRAEGSR